MIRCALYCRYSDEAQNDSSIEQQLRLLRARVESEGWLVVAEFEDRAYTGTNAFRPGFQALRQAAEDGRFDVVLSESVDRLSRNLGDMAKFAEALSYRGISIVTLLEGEIDTMKIAFKGGMASLYSKDLGRRVHRGLTQRVLEGESAGGLAYGYDVHREWDPKGKRVGRSRVVNEEQAKIVRRIFEEYAGGKSPRKIAHDLNAEGIMTQSGRLWRDSTIYGNRRRGTGIINNELYIGRVIWGRQSFSKNPDTGRETGRMNGKDKWVTSDAPHLRIIDDALWQRVKDMQRDLDAKSKSNAGKQRPKRLFSFLLTCGECGGGMAILGRRHYGCSNARAKGPAICSNRLTVAEDRLKEMTFHALQNHIMDPVLCEEFHRIYVAHQETIRADNSAAFEDNRAELDKTERAIEKLADAIANGIDPSLLKSKSDALLERKRQLTTALEQRTEAPRFVHPDMGYRFRKAVREVVNSFAVPEHHTEAAKRLRGLIDKIVLRPNAARNELDIDMLGDIENIIRLSADRRRTERLTPADRIAAQSELGQIRWLAGPPRRMPPPNRAGTRKMPDFAQQGMMVGVKSDHQSLPDSTQPQVVMAGAAGFEPANGGTKSRCLTTWRRPSMHGRTRLGSFGSDALKGRGRG